jgi:hypothetical protein
MAGQGRKVFTAGDVLTASQVQDYLQDQAVMVFAGTAARSSAIATPSEGMVSVQTDTDDLTYYNGSAWTPGLSFGAWKTSWTPTFTNFSIGNGTITRAVFTQIGKTVHLDLIVTLGSTSAVSGRIGFSLPVTSAYNFTNPVTLCDLSAGAANANGVANQASTTQMELYAINSAGTYIVRASTSSIIPGTWAAGSSFALKYTYEAA